MRRYEQVEGREDQETFVSIDYEERTVSVYSNRATVMNRMVGAGYEPTREFSLDGEVCACEWVFPSSSIGKFMRTGLFKFD